MSKLAEVLLLKKNTLRKAYVEKSRRRKKCGLTGTDARFLTIFLSANLNTERSFIICMLCSLELSRSLRGILGGRTVPIRTKFE